MIEVQIQQKKRGPGFELEDLGIKVADIDNGWESNIKHANGGDQEKYDIMKTGPSAMSVIDAAQKKDKQTIDNSAGRLIEF